MDLSAGEVIWLWQPCFLRGLLSKENSVSKCVWVVFVLAGCVCLTAGCQKREETNSVKPLTYSKVKRPLLAGIRLDAIKSKLDSVFTVRSDGSPFVLARAADPQEIVIVVDHNGQGDVHSVSVEVAGPADTGAKILGHYVETIKTVGEALGVTDANYALHTDVGLIKTSVGVSYGFKLGKLAFLMMPSRPVQNTSTTVAFKPNTVQRSFLVTPQVGSELPSQPIRGASLAQLETLLTGFTVKAKVEGQEIVYVREKPTHTDVVFCSLEPQGGVSRVEAYVSEVKEGDILVLSQELWGEIAGFEYQGCNKDKFLDFLKAPKETYAAVPAFAEIGYATVSLPIGLDGKRTQLGIYPRDPTEE
jgi:hypothetical protein